MNDSPLFANISEPAPRQGAAQATCAARNLEECILGARYRDMPADGQTEVTAAAHILEFPGGLWQSARCEP